MHRATFWIVVFNGFDEYNWEDKDRHYQPRKWHFDYVESECHHKHSYDDTKESRQRVLSNFSDKDSKDFFSTTRITVDFGNLCEAFSGRSLRTNPFSRYFVKISDFQNPPKRQKRWIHKKIIIFFSRSRIFSAFLSSTGNVKHRNFRQNRSRGSEVIKDIHTQTHKRSFMSFPTTGDWIEVYKWG